MIEEMRRERDRQKRTEEEGSSKPQESREADKKRSGREGRSKSGRPSRRLDIIDQLDATSIYGTGRKYTRPGSLAHSRASEIGQLTRVH